MQTGNTRGGARAAAGRGPRSSAPTPGPPGGDFTIRRALLTRLANAATSRDAIIVEELGLCQNSVRVDVALVGDELHGFEIKSARDTLRRLPRQAGYFNRALERVTLVTCREHRAGIDEIAPPWWGIWEADGDGRGVELKVVREGEPNPAIDPYALAQFLWSAEALEVLRARGLERGVLSKPRKARWRRLADEVATEELRALVRARLRERPVWQTLDGKERVSRPGG